MQVFQHQQHRGRRRELGEQPEDLQPFDADSYAKAVFGLEG